MNPTQLLSIAKARWLTVVLSMIVVLAAAIGLTAKQVPLYSSEAEVLIQVTDAQERFGTGQDSTFLRERNLRNEVAFAKSDRVRLAAESDVGDELEIEILSGNGSDTIEFHALETSPDGAALAANVYAEAFVAQRIEAATESYLESSAVLQQQRDEIQERRKDLGEEISLVEEASLDAQELQIGAALQDLLVVSRLSGAGSAQIINAAISPDQPTSPNWLMNVVAATILGALVGAGLALVKDHFDDTVRSESDLERANGHLPTLSTIPAPVTKTKSGLVAIHTSAQSPAFVEGIRGLRSAIRLAGEMREPISSILITSANPSEGKSTTASALAVSYARAGFAVLLIDMDLRAPTIHSQFGLENDFGLADAISARTEPPIFEVGDGGQWQMSVVTAGSRPEDPADIVSSEVFEKLMTDFKSIFNIVILDSPPILPVADALTLSRTCEATVLVTRCMKTSSSDVSLALERLRRTNAPVLGSVLTGTPQRLSYGYGTDPTDRSDVASPVASGVARTFSHSVEDHADSTASDDSQGPASKPTLVRQQSTRWHRNQDPEENS
ncbi:MAG: polysaccharide biosynthesis tyrosine autokinase [Acidimicrobiales bacterium]